MNGTVRIWYQDPAGFISADQAAVFFPMADMSREEQMNSILRFSVYFTLIVYLWTLEARVWAIPVGMALVTAAMYAWVPYGKASATGAAGREGFGRGRRQPSCRRPTVDNPFMNVLMNEYTENPERSAACDIERPSVKCAMTTSFDERVFRDIDDIFHKNASDRQFYTMPNTRIPNGQTEFADWLYKKREPTCKEGSGVQCFANMNFHRAV